MSKAEQLSGVIDMFLKFHGGTDDKWWLQASIKHYLESGTVSGSLHQAIAEVFNAGYTAKEQEHRWVSVSERLPEDKDLNEDGEIDACYYSSIIDAQKVVRISLASLRRNLEPTWYWRTPLPNNFPPNQ